MLLAVRVKINKPNEWVVMNFFIQNIYTRDVSGGLFINTHEALKASFPWAVITFIWCYFEFCGDFFFSFDKTEEEFCFGKYR